MKHILAPEKELSEQAQNKEASINNLQYGINEIGEHLQCVVHVSEANVGGELYIDPDSIVPNTFSLNKALIESCCDGRSNKLYIDLGITGFGHLPGEEVFAVY